MYPSRHQYKEYIFLQTARRTTRSGIITTTKYKNYNKNTFSHTTNNKQNQLWLNTRQLFTYYYELLLHFQVNIHSHTLKHSIKQKIKTKNRHGNFLSMMKTTCVDEERIQRVDSTYLYLQKKEKELRKMLRRKLQFIHPSFTKENTARLSLLVPISSVKTKQNTQGCCHPHWKKSDSSLNLFLKYYF